MERVPIEIIESKIYLIRNQRVMLDSDIAELYGVTTKRFNEQVKRNIERFPEDFMFKLTDEEYKILRSQFATSNIIHGGRRYTPYVFTEHGAIMAATILNSSKAVEMSIFVVRAFVKLREITSSNKELAQKLNELEKKYEKHDKDIKAIIDAIRQLMTPPEKTKRKIGFIK
ncbi:MAG: ORF6N domain-containing protein [Candidatus Acidulodesulfobacterium acidiphilum]|uniref:ORF6N domain-containing protein n=1 Tax=Candidatus Acidulodesulfobacterium acidiphilum TaxID=2597224 RepID=A0A520XD75_9DELT|nr:MAG: ORF6N domain-containing protein [Candidatus Acidulodesulfobacterium acidiphilum]